MHRHYGGIPEGISLSVLVKMIEQAFEFEMENQVKPIWFLRAAIDGLRGIETTVSVSDMIAEIKNKVMHQPVKERTSEDIMEDFMKIIERDRNG